MKKAILILTMTLLNIGNVVAQKITNENELKNFYIEYFSNAGRENEVLKDSLVTVYCTKELYTAWHEDVYDIGLYDPLTNGLCENPEMMKKTLVVKKDSDGYSVSFDYLTWPDNKTETETVIIYVNADGKISHTKRPEDGYMTPSK